MDLRIESMLEVLNPDAHRASFQDDEVRGCVPIRASFQDDEIKPFADRQRQVLHWGTHHLQLITHNSAILFSTHPCPP